MKRIREVYLEVCYTLSNEYRYIMHLIIKLGCDFSRARGANNNKNGEDRKKK
jgi:hypothetical protein